MPKKITPALVKKYDISQKIFHELANLESRSILFSIVKKSKTAKDISKEVKIPLSSVYTKIHNLINASLGSEARIDFSPEGRVIRYYQSRIANAQISISKFEPSISFHKNSKVKKGLNKHI